MPRRACRARLRVSWSSTPMRHLTVTGTSPPPSSGKNAIGYEVRTLCEVANVPDCTRSDGQPIEVDLAIASSPRRSALPRRAWLPGCRAVVPPAARWLHRSESSCSLRALLMAASATTHLGVEQRTTRELAVEEPARWSVQSIIVATASIGTLFLCMFHSGSDVTQFRVCTHFTPKIRRHRH